CVPEVLELAWIFMSLVSVPRAQRIPSLKEVVRDLKLDTASMALLSYPILQAADILMVKGDLVPVGKDQLSHIELTREIARRFNDTFAPVFPVPEGLVGTVPTLPGTDGQAKMGKSLGNAIFLRDDAEKGLVEAILSGGTAKARDECLQTLSEAREAMGLTYFRGRHDVLGAK